MSLTPQQSALLQYYMQKNRNVPQPVQAPPLPANVSSGGSAGPGLASILGTLGGWMDTKAPISGPLQPGAMRPTVTQPSFLTNFANQLDPQAALIKQYLQMTQKQPDIAKLLMNMGRG